MYELSKKELEKMGADITTREIKQQPELWQETLEIYRENQAALETFLNEIKQQADEKIRVIFTGAGTSQYVGDTLVPYLRKNGDTTAYSFESIGTTDIVSCPDETLMADEPTLLVSFARSGNSPESVAAVNLASNNINNIHHLMITCAKDGALAVDGKQAENTFVLLMPELSNDDGFAMTGSFTCMTLAALLTFDIINIETKAKYVAALSELGHEVVAREAEIKQIVDHDFERIIYLGSGSLSGLTREAQLKVLELTAGQVATVFDSSMGFRHGPKSFVNDKTLVFDFVNNEAYTRDYDLDVMEEIKDDDIAVKVTTVGQAGKRNFSGDKFEFGRDSLLLPDGYLALADVMFAQTLALLTSVKIDNKPDTPSPTGTVNRVVKGVKIHRFK
ncbi:SIS domain-containing protein [Ligilactobacillus pobuzihii]|uniref:AgaS protein n=1 Tax=Ligilactobacillus pobuzihii TaxID=449659 RepID=A0A0R2LKC2_9LACO|nr:SIS domain-containing protein [Ligilactobacillus pobuzihii]KRK10409.1 agaS protein [Ligilactobacillus pobuzihii E100301 = KCTC 13174]KRN98612.1 agaS protein [Ligilactobacillus pobuzihii]GEN47588.1 tagatose-6-phosphate ketose [Ligilactobacillus pobuzihii]